MVVETLESWEPPPADEWRRGRDYREFRRAVDAAYERRWWAVFLSDAFRFRGRWPELRPAVAAIAVATVFAVTASYWPRGDREQLGVGELANVVAESDSGAGPNLPDRSGGGGGVGFGSCTFCIVEDFHSSGEWGDSDACGLCFVVVNGDELGVGVYPLSYFTVFIIVCSDSSRERSDPDTFSAGDIVIGRHPFSKWRYPHNASTIFIVLSVDRSG